MTSPDDLIRLGDLDGARAALIAEVKANPDSRPARMFLSQVLLVLGEWDKALTHMKALAGLSPEALSLFTAYDRAIAAERQRETVFAGRAAPVVHEEGGAWFGKLCRALEADLAGDESAAASLRAEAFEEAPETPGEIDGHRFAFLSDVDARFGPAIEAIIEGQYGLIPFEAIAALESDGVRDLRDLVFLPARLTLKSGRAGQIFLPARYPGAATDTDALVRLARRTEWRARGDLGNVGRGQRMLDADGQEIPLLGLRRLQFDL